MSRQHIDDILRQWPSNPRKGDVRIVHGGDGREVLQLRIDLGLMQLEIKGRPDGEQPEGYETYYDYLTSLSIQKETAGEEFTFSEEQCLEVDREFVQFYHRRICWLQMSRYKEAVRDADHTLGLMDLCREHSPEEAWTLSHEQYRPYVLYHRTQAAALEALDRTQPEDAVQAINDGLERLRELFANFDLEEHFDEHELVTQLREMREDVREKYSVGRTLQEQLSDAVAQEKYELAARLRDELAGRGGKL